ncbi:histidine kinase [Nostoc sp. CMAA1605]|nr:histidine kinase [Nostoc sp. CMAA1605]
MRQLKDRQGGRGDKVDKVEFSPMPHAPCPIPNPQSPIPDYDSSCTYP